MASIWEGIALVVLRVLTFIYFVVRFHEICLHTSSHRYSWFRFEQMVQHHNHCDLLTPPPSLSLTAHPCSVALHTHKLVLMSKGSQGVTAPVCNLTVVLEAEWEKQVFQVSLSYIVSLRQDWVRWKDHLMRHLRLFPPLCLLKKMAVTSQVVHDWWVCKTVRMQVAGT